VDAGSSNSIPSKRGTKGKRELIRYITRKTGVDEGTVLKVLNAEEEFFVLQVEKALRKRGGGVAV
jgi:hypothetical protein